MIVTHFIESILGEPLTAVDNVSDQIAIGSISGYYGLYNKITK